MKMKSFFLVSTNSKRFHRKERQTLNFFFVLVLLIIFVNPTMSINNGSVGLVGYNVRLTKRQAIRGRSPVRFWYGILFLPIAVPCTARGAFWMDERRFRSRSNFFTTTYTIKTIKTTCCRRAAAAAVVVVVVVVAYLSRAISTTPLFSNLSSTAIGPTDWLDRNSPERLLLTRCRRSSAW